MGHAIVVIFSWVFFISISALLVVILGTYLADTFKDSRFDKWWRRHIIDDIPVVEEIEYKDHNNDPIVEEDCGCDK